MPTTPGLGALLPPTQASGVEAGKWAVRAMAVLPGKNHVSGDDEQALGAGVLQFPGAGVRRGFAIDQARTKEDVGRRSVRKDESVRQEPGRHPADIEGPGPGLLVDTRVAGDEHSQRRDAGSFFTNVWHMILLAAQPG